MNEKIKTGTTCIGLKYNYGLILAADRRVTTYKIESDTFTKIFDVSGSIVATVAGHAAPSQLFMRYLKSQVKLIKYQNERPATVKEAAMILNSVQYSAVRSQGAVVSSILGGYDIKDGFSLYNLSHDGTIVSHDGYITTGSGSLYVKSLLDNKYSSSLSKEEALKLLDDCFKVAFKNDNASGGGYIAKIITKDNTTQLTRKVKSEIIEA